MNIDLFIYIGLFFSAIYTLILLSFVFGISSLTHLRDKYFKQISVIIAARNEEKHLPALLKAIAKQEYPTNSFQVIIVDDRSVDNTWQILSNEIKKYDWLQIFRVTEENPELVGKKGALKLGITKAKYEILAFTDADCLPGRKWLKEINALMTAETDFLCGYSPLIGTGRFVGLLKNLERSSIFAVIAGSFGLGWDITSVARNQVYRKSNFMKINGFAGIGKQRSGDDDLLLQKMSPVIRKRNFIFEPLASVESFDKPNMQEQIHLETRRSSKWKLYPLPIQLLTLFVLVFYLIIACAFILTIFGNLSWLQFIFLNLPKILGEFILLDVFLTRTGQLKQLIVFPIAEILYIPYYVYFGLRGTFGTYKWKK
ncbi:MAG: glycosyltransferase [Candidatus Stygibacter frigidus]|nr:glycosyltransferase [Candidatus Stygibacter frigidus]